MDGKLAKAVIEGDEIRVKELSGKLYDKEELLDWITQEQFGIIIDNLYKTFPDGIEPENYKKALKFILISAEILCH